MRCIAGVSIGPPNGSNAPKPTSSPTIISTFGAPGGATGCRNGPQSGSASRISVATRPFHVCVAIPLTTYEEGLTAQNRNAAVADSGKLQSNCEDLPAHGGQYRLGIRPGAHLVDTGKVVDDGQRCLDHDTCGGRVQPVVYLAE